MCCVCVQHRQCRHVLDGLLVLHNRVLVLWQTGSSSVEEMDAKQRQRLARLVSIIPVLKDVGFMVVLLAHTLMHGCCQATHHGCVCLLQHAPLGVPAATHAGNSDASAPPVSLCAGPHITKVLKVAVRCVDRSSSLVAAKKWADLARLFEQLATAVTALFQ